MGKPMTNLFLYCEGAALLHDAEHSLASAKTCAIGVGWKMLGSQCCVRGLQPRSIWCLCMGPQLLSLSCAKDMREHGRILELKHAPTSTVAVPSVLCCGTAVCVDPRAGPAESYGWGTAALTPPFHSLTEIPMTVFVATNGCSHPSLLSQKTSPLSVPKEPGVCVTSPGWQSVLAPVPTTPCTHCRDAGSPSGQ